MKSNPCTFLTVPSCCAIYLQRATWLRQLAKRRVIKDKLITTGHGRKKRHVLEPFFLQISQVYNFTLAGKGQGEKAKLYYTTTTHTHTRSLTDNIGWNHHIAEAPRKTDNIIFLCLKKNTPVHLMCFKNHYVLCSFWYL